MMDYLLVALIIVSNTDSAVYNFEVMAEYRTMEDCEKSRRRAVKNSTTKLVSLVCAKRDWD